MPIQPLLSKSVIVRIDSRILARVIAFGPSAATILLTAVSNARPAFHAPTAHDCGNSWPMLLMKVSISLLESRSSKGTNGSHS